MKQHNPDLKKPHKKSIGYFALGEIIQNPIRRFGFVALILTANTILFFLSSCAGGKEDQSVVIYTSQDEEFADPIFKDFQKETGIVVKPVYDSEAVKTIGLVNRLLAENPHPQCDVFWNNEEFRTRQLAARNIFRETNGWTLLGYRTRRLVVNTNLLAPGQAPKNFSEVTNEQWHGRVAIAYPMFGTTCTHFLALRQHWGDAGWQAWCRGLVANKTFLLEGNSVAAKHVGGGEATVGFTDSDDAASEQADGRPVAVMPLTDESLVVHNTAGMIRNAPHPAAAQKLYDYLQSAVVQEKLVAAKALESATPGDPASLPGLKVNWNDMLRDLDAGTDEMKKIFLR